MTFLRWLLSLFRQKQVALVATPFFHMNPTPEPILPQPEPVIEPIDRLEQFATCIRDYEGKPGDLNYINNNPGNCRYSPIGYLPSYWPVKKDVHGFAVFKDYETGFRYLKNLIKGKVAKNPNQTLFQFMAMYAPDNENDPVAYANYLAHRLGVSVDTPMKLLV